MGSTTDKKALFKPVSGEKGWGGSVNENMDKLDDIYFVQGADVVSEAALFTTAGYPTDGHYFDVTGTTTVTSILTSGRIGQIIILQTDGIVTFTHNATDLICPDGEDIKTRAGERLMLREYAAGDWEVISGPLLSKEQAVKGWINLNAIGVIATNDSYNVSGIVDNGPGDISVTWDIDFANDNYAVVATGRRLSADASNVCICSIEKTAGNPAVGSVRIIIVDTLFAALDVEKLFVIAIGDR